METSRSPFSEENILHSDVNASYMKYLNKKTEMICVHLDKLDRLPLLECFDFRKYFGQNEFIYSGDSDPAQTDRS
jgi:hypothetical protein